MTGNTSTRRLTVAPAKAGVQFDFELCRYIWRRSRWIPAFAGMSTTSRDRNYCSRWNESGQHAIAANPRAATLPTDKKKFLRDTSGRSPGRQISCSALLPLQIVQLKVGMPRGLTHSRPMLALLALALGACDTRERFCAPRRPDDKSNIDLWNEA